MKKYKLRKPGATSEPLKKEVAHIWLPVSEAKNIMEALYFQFSPYLEEYLAPVWAQEALEAYLMLRKHLPEILKENFPIYKLNTNEDGNCINYED